MLFLGVFDCSLPMLWEMKQKVSGRITVACFSFVKGKKGKFSCCFKWLFKETFRGMVGEFSSHFLWHFIFCSEC